MIPHPIPYQGSKRSLANNIISFLPKDTKRLIEPFAGSAAVSLAAAYYNKAECFIINDINNALMKLWEEIINRPDTLASAYEKQWYNQLGQERNYYDIVRKKFNKTQEPDLFLYLLARCVKASVRYNSAGEFNQSPDNRRKGMRPITMKLHINGASKLFRGRTIIKCKDYLELLNEADILDVIYMDPPYQGVCGKKDPRYITGTSYNNFIEALDYLNKKNISYIVSYDGRTGTKNFGTSLPESLKLRHVELNAGRSSQATLLGRNEYTIESLYISPSLVNRLKNNEHIVNGIAQSQICIFGG